MHIAFLTPEYPRQESTPAGGLGTSIESVVNALNARGFQVSVFIYGQQHNKTFSENNVSYHFIAQKKYPVLGWYLYRSYLQKYIQKYIDLDNVELLEVPDWTGISAFMNLKIPIVMRLNGSDAYFCHIENRKQKPKNRFFEFRAYKKADYIISVSEFTGKLSNEIFGTDRKFKVIPNSVDTEKFNPKNSIVEENTILYFGTIIRKKGVLELAEIFNEVINKNPNASLKIAGRDVVDVFEKKSTLKLFREKLSEDASTRMDYLGALNYKDIAQEIEKASVIVLPSFAEALPMTWIEAMAMEKPLVTSNIGWAEEVMINGKTGFTVDPKSHEEFSGKILWLLKNPKKAKEMGRMLEYVK